MAEKQQEHRMRMEHDVIHSNITMEHWGLGAGFVLAVIFALGGIWLTSEGKELTGLIVLTGEVVTLVGVFLFAREQRQQELEERKEAQKEGPTASTDLAPDLSEVKAK